MKEYLYKYKSAIFAFAFLTLAVGAARAQVASNPPYTLNQSAIAGGGGRSADAANTFTVEGTIGQAVTETSGATPFTVRSGFFTAAAPLAPTAATVTVSGRVRTANGRGIRNVRVTMTDAAGVVRTATTGAFGAFRFFDVAVGDTYIFAARGKRYDFAEPTLIVSVTDEAANVNFTAIPR